MERRKPLRRTGFARRPAESADADAAWSDAVLLRDGGCTFPHGSFGIRCWGKLAAHHVILRRHKATRHDVDNGTALCIPAHDYVHRNPKWAKGVGLLASPGTRVVRGRAFPS
jgi:hypothetical protein